MAIAISSEGTGGTTSDGSGNFVRGGIFYKIVNVAADEPVSYTFLIGATQQVGWWIGSLSGLSSVVEDVAFSGAGAWVNRQNDTSPNTPAVTTVTNGAMALACWVLNSDSATTQPGGSWLARADDVGGNGCLNVASRIFPTAGTTTGTPEITDVAGNQESEVGMFVLRPVTTKENRVSHAGAYAETTQEIVEVSHAGAYVETDQEIVEVSHAGAYVEASQKLTAVSHAGAYVEASQKAVFISHAGAYVE